jgi:predicted ATPase/class 3 adenylate cyclase
MADRPRGTVTFLFTDIEGSTRRWEKEPDAMRVALAEHDDVLRSAIENHGGWLFKHTGDGACAAFTSARAAVEATIDAQRRLKLPVRIGIATGEADLRDDDYFGPPLNRAARVMAAGHGGQVLAAASTVALIDGFELMDLGPHRLRDLSEPIHLFQVCADGLERDFPPLQTLDTVPGNLPAQATSFIGRQHEVAAVSEALRAHRLVTLVGVGGVGKTRLALQTAAEMLDHYRDGAWLVELAPILDAAELTEGVAAVFSVSPQASGWRAALTDALRGRQMLLVLDNCEHVLDEAASLVQALLSSCPELTVLATSREALGVAGEVTWPVPSLGLGADAAATTLFIERAQEVAPDFGRTTDLEVISEICRRLDGIPLAIELAAARVRAMSPAQIRDRLDERFRLLTGSRRSMERHQTLRHAVQWSYDLLNDAEREVLQCASVFAGGFTLAGALAVCGNNSLDEIEMLDLLDSLVRKSLVNVDRSSAELRYSMLETIRQFAEERLAESGAGETARERHALFFADRSEASFEDFRSPREALAYRFVDDDMPNIRAAFRWAMDHGQSDSAIRIAACVHQAARFRLRTETFGWCAEVAGIARELAHRKLPLLLTMATDSSWAMGRLEEAKKFGHEAISLLADPRFESIAWAYADLAQIAFFEGDVEGGVKLIRDGAEEPCDKEDRFVLACLPVTCAYAGQQLTAEEIADCISKVNTGNFPTAIAYALAGKAIQLAEVDPLASIEDFRVAIHQLEACGDRLMEQHVRSLLLSVLSRSEDQDTALASFIDIVSDWQIAGDTLLGMGVGHLVLLLARLGHTDGAARLYGAVTRSIALDALVPGIDSAITGVRAELGEAAFTAARDAGAAMSYQAAGELARSLIQKARVDLVQP